MLVHNTAANDEMVEGYLDGFKDDRTEYPESLSNRTASYRHGWLNGRDDRIGKPRAFYADLIRMAEEAMAQDARQTVSETQGRAR